MAVRELNLAVERNDGFVRLVTRVLIGWVVVDLQSQWWHKDDLAGEALLQWKFGTTKHDRKTGKSSVPASSQKRKQAKSRS